MDMNDLDLDAIENVDGGIHKSIKIPTVKEKKKSEVNLNFKMQEHILICYIMGRKCFFFFFNFYLHTVNQLMFSSASQCFSQSGANISNGPYYASDVLGILSATILFVAKFSVVG